MPAASGCVEGSAAYDPLGRRDEHGAHSCAGNGGAPPVGSRSRVSSRLRIQRAASAASRRDDAADDHGRQGKCAMNVLHVVPRLSVGGILTLIDTLPASDLSISHDLLAIFGANTADWKPTASLSTSCLGISLEHYSEVDHISRLVQQEIEAGHYDIITTHHCFADIYALPAARKAALPAIRMVHGISQATWENPASRTVVQQEWDPHIRQLELALESDTVRTIAVSSQIERTLISYGIRHDTISVVSPGVNIDLPMIAPASLGNSVDLRLRIAYFHRLEPVKNPFSLIPIVKALQHKGVTPRIFLPESGSCLRELRHKIVTNALVDCFSFIPATYPIASRLDAMDVFLLTSHSEGAPISVLEAMARGIPPICSNVGDLSNIISHGSTGYLFEPHNILEIADYMHLLALSKSLRTKMGFAAQQAVRNHYSATKFRHEVFRIFQLVKRGIPDD